MGRRAALVEGDVFRRPSCESVVARAIEALGRIDILVSNPAFNRRADFLEYDPETFARVIEGTLTGGFHMGQLVARHMVERGGGGKIVFISSCHVKTPYARSVAYNAAKAGLNNMAFTIATELYRHRINVNVIEPGWIDTPGRARVVRQRGDREGRPDAALGPARHARGHRQGRRVPRLRRRRLHHRHGAGRRRRHLAPIGVGVSSGEPAESLDTPHEPGSVQLNTSLVFIRPILDQPLNPGSSSGGNPIRRLIRWITRQERIDDLEFKLELARARGFTKPTTKGQTALAASRAKRGRIASRSVSKGKGLPAIPTDGRRPLFRPVALRASR